MNKFLGQVVEGILTSIIDTLQPHEKLKLLFEEFQEDECKEIFEYLATNNSLGFDFLLPKKPAFTESVYLSKYTSNQTCVKLRNVSVDKHTLAFLTAKESLVASASLNQRKLSPKLILESGSVYWVHAMIRFMKDKFQEKEADYENFIQNIFPELHKFMKDNSQSDDNFSINYEDDVQYSFFDVLSTLILNNYTKLNLTLSDISRYLREVLEDWFNNDTEKKYSQVEFWNLASDKLRVFRLAKRGVSLNYFFGKDSLIVTKENKRKIKLKGNIDKAGEQLVHHKRQLPYLMCQIQYSNRKSQDNLQTYTKRDLQKNLEKLKKEESFKETPSFNADIKVIETFIESDYAWSDIIPQDDPVRKAFLDINWQYSSMIFFPKQEKKDSIGQKTKKYLESEPEHFKEILENLPDEVGVFKKRNFNEDDINVKNWVIEHLEILSDSLKKKWTAILNKEIKMYEDLDDAILITIGALLATYADTIPESPKFVISLDKRTLWSKKSQHMAKYIYFRYKKLNTKNAPFMFYLHGLSDLLHKDRTLLSHEELSKKKAERFSTEPNPTKHILKFHVWLTSEEKAQRYVSASHSADEREQEEAKKIFNEEKKKGSLIFYYHFQDGVLRSFAKDIEQINSHLQDKKCIFSNLRASRNYITQQGAINNLSLKNVHSFKDVNQNEEGQFIPFHTNIQNTNVIQSIKDFAQLKQLKITEHLDKFEQAYMNFFQGFMQQDTLYLVDKINLLTELYKDLLYAIRKYNDSESKKNLWIPLLNIGCCKIVEFTDDENIDSTKYMIVTPFNPLRLQEIAIKIQQRNTLISEGLKHKDSISRKKYIDKKVFEQRAQHLSNVYYPNLLCLGRIDLGDFEHVGQTISKLGDYSLAEAIKSDADLSVENKEIKDVCKEFLSLIEKYMSLTPHHKYNITVALYAVKNFHLLDEIIQKLSNTLLIVNPKLNIVLCFIAERDFIENAYSETMQIIEENNEFIVDEYGRSRLRIQFVTKEELKSLSYKFNILLLYNLLSEQGAPKWVKRTQNEHLDALSIYPNSYSPIIPYDAAHNKIQTYLSHKYQTELSQVYTNLLADIAQSQYYAETTDSHDHKEFPDYGCIFEVQFEETASSLKDDLKQLRQKSDWIISYDNIADVKTFQNNDFKIIRHYTTPSHKKIVVATGEETLLMNRLLKKRLGVIEQKSSKNFEDKSSLVDKLKAQAEKVSGLVVLRASKNGSHASELIGNVAAMHRIRQFLNNFKSNAQAWHDLSAWISLDDYKYSFDAHIGQIADILVVSPIVEGDRPENWTLKRTEDNKLCINVIISECKAMARSSTTIINRSIRQLVTTYEKFERAMQKNSLHRQIYLQVLADIYQEHVVSTRQSKEVYNALIKNNVSLRFFGFSHSAIYNESGESECVVNPKTAKTLFSHEKAIILDKIYPDELYEIFENIGKDFIETGRFPSKNPASLLRLIDEGKTQDQNLQKFFALSNLIENSDQSVSAITLIDADSEHTSPKFDSEEVENFDDSTEDVSSSEELPFQYEEAEGIILGEDFEAEAQPPAVDTVEQTEAIEPDNNAKDVIDVVEQDGVEDENQETSEVTTQGAFMACREKITNFLRDDAAEFIPDNNAQPWLEKVTENLLDGLRNQNLTAILKSKTLTPTSARIVIHGHESLDSEKIMKQSHNFKSRYRVDIREVESGLGCLIFYINRPTNLERNFIPFSKKILEIQEQREWPSENRKLFIAVSEEDGTNIFMDHASDPHVLIAGSSGSGKGLLIKNLIFDICLSNSPKRAQIWVIDPKYGHDFEPWLGYLPHVQKITPESKDTAILNQEESITMFEQISSQMESRIREARIRMREGTLDSIWIIHDEFESWFNDENYAERVNNNIKNLARQARAAQIYLIFATQRPSVGNLDASVRNNFGNRLVLKVSSEGDSKIAFGEDKAGAHKLLGKGHIITKSDGIMNKGQVPSFAYNRNDFKKLDELAKLIAEYWRHEPI